MGATEDFLAEMQRRRQAQLQQIKGMFAENPGKGLNMQPANIGPGFVGNIIRSITGLVSGNALQSKGASALGNLAGLFGGSAGVSAAGTSLANPAGFNAASSGLKFFL